MELNGRALFRRLWPALLLLGSFPVAAQNETYRVALIAHSPPLSYTDQAGKFTGFNVEIATELCATMKIRCVQQRVPIDRIVDMAAADQVDFAVVGFFATPERRTRVLFSKDYYQSVSVWLAKPALTVGHAGSVVAVIKGSAQGNNQGYIALFADITERKALEAKMHQMAFFDALTGLPNRRMLDDRLGHAMAASKRSGLYGALMFMDLDNFKPLNDNHGHEMGDLLLIEVARRLTECLREADTVARFGGDEFVVMLTELATDKAQSIEQAAGVAEKIRASLAEPFQLTVTQPGEESQTVEHQCSTSIGVVVFVNHEASQSDLMKWADSAMYQAKDAGCNLVRFYAETKLS